VPCNAGDYALSGGYLPESVGPGFDAVHIGASYPTKGGSPSNSGTTPDGWSFEGSNDRSDGRFALLWVECQTPITVAGIGVPQFVSLYVAIALGAAVYFLLAKRQAGAKSSTS
jgi:hypothetical protein